MKDRLSHYRHSSLYLCLCLTVYLCLSSPLAGTAVERQDVNKYSLFVATAHNGTVITYGEVFGRLARNVDRFLTNSIIGGESFVTTFFALYDKRDASLVTLDLGHSCAGVHRCQRQSRAAPLGWRAAPFPDGLPLQTSIAP